MEGLNMWSTPGILLSAATLPVKPISSPFGATRSVVNFMYLAVETKQYMVALDKRYDVHYFCKFSHPITVVIWLDEGRPNPPRPE